MMINVHYELSTITIDEEVARKHGMVNDAEIPTEEKFWAVLGDSCRAGMAFCDRMIAEREQDKKGK